MEVILGSQSFSYACYDNFAFWYLLPRNSHSEVFLGKGVLQIYRKTPMAKSDFNKGHFSHSEIKSYS